MKIIQTNPDFYIEISLEEIRLCTPLACSIYPVWLGKNRAIMRDVVAYFEKHPPETLVDCLHIISIFQLNGQRCSEPPLKELFKKDKKGLDKPSIFW